MSIARQLCPGTADGDGVRNKLLTIRDRVLAHADLIETDEINELFHEITPIKIERLLAFLNQVHIALRSLFENGHSPRWSPKRLPVWRRSLADDVREDVNRLLDGLTTAPLPVHPAPPHPVGMP
jgi:hypothetical protein